MIVRVEDYPHRTGEHCASTALRNILAHRGTDLSESMVFGLASGLGFLYLDLPGLSPSRLFHGRTAWLETDFCRNTAIPFEDRPEPDDDRAWQIVRERIDAGSPVMVSTDSYYLGYQRTTSHFPGHRCVVVGYDAEAGEALIADRKFEEYQRCGLDELRRARNAPDYAMSCENRYGDFLGDLKPGRPLREAICVALRRNARAMLEPEGELPAGLPAMRTLARGFPGWAAAEDWSWAARFGYQVVVKRGSGGSCFRSLYADFLREAAALFPGLRAGGFAGRMDGIARRWRELAAVLKQQSEREVCAPELFARAGVLTGELADAEEAVFRDLLALEELRSEA